MTGSLLGFIALAIALGTTLRWFQLARAVALPERRTPFLAAWLAAVGLGVVALFAGPGWAGGTAAGIAVFVGLFVTLTVAVSRQVAAPDAVRVGDRLPAFEAPDEHGERFSSEALVGHPVLIKFFRAHW